MEIIVNTEKSSITDINPLSVESYLSELKGRLLFFYPASIVTVTAEERHNYVEVIGEVNISDAQTVSTVTDEIFNSGTWRQ